MNTVLESNSTRNANNGEPVIRCRWRVTGRVQGVGFRPLVFRLAKRIHIRGAVWNDADGVIAEGQGTRPQLDEFLSALRSEAPAAAVIRDIFERQIPIEDHGKAFEIRPSPQSDISTAEVAADLAICPKCLADIRDKSNARRHRYALTNCTNCGPRFSIIRAIPYDRCNTTMAPFLMCPKCHSEYEDPGDRRFHAQPTACRNCGPRLKLLEPKGNPIYCDPILATAQRLVRGNIIAIKGIGGFHLAARADDEATIARLRKLKHRPAKPFALMCASLEAARRLVQLRPAGESLLTSPAAPIVLAPRLADAPVASAVAPGQHRLGVMLAYTPLHHLIFDQLQSSGVDALVMTSGNDSDEPLVFEDADAPARLGEMCDAILLHDRPIQRAVDDTVVIDGENAPIFVRRARGYVPTPISLPQICDSSPGLAVGAEMKCTVAISRNGHAVLSQHLGNLTHARAFDAFKRAIDDLQQLFTVKPQWIAHDLHPAYLSTQYAKQLAAELKVPLIGVQHHHAHAAAVLAENACVEPALALVCDGTGYGTDGTIWGGELLVATLDDFRRIARLRPITLPGGDACATQPWRTALALLYTAYGSEFRQLPICQQLADAEQLQFVRQMLLNGVSCISSSSTGRLFDGIAALLGLCRENRFDAKAPMTLEAAASSAHLPKNFEPAYALKETDGLIEVDLMPFVRNITQPAERAEAPGSLALSFHQTLAAAWTDAIDHAMRQTNLQTVALSGGSLCNSLLGDLLTQNLQNLGHRVLRHRDVPPNDGGVAYGQAAVASARLKLQAEQKGRPACA